jgi:hypothetical protein
MSEGTAMCSRPLKRSPCITYLHCISHDPVTRTGGRGTRWSSPLAVGVWRSFAHAFTDDVGAASGNRTRGSSLEG